MGEPTREEKAAQIISAVMKEMGSKLKITDLSYRNDYQDFQVIFDDRYHAEFRQKLIDTFAADKTGDVKREIVFRIENPMEFEDWEDKPGDVPQGGDDRMVIDDNEKYDI